MLFFSFTQFKIILSQSFCVQKYRFYVEKFELKLVQFFDCMKILFFNFRKHSFNEDKQFNTLDSNKSTQHSLPWPQIVTEVWTEPQSCINNFAEIDSKEKVNFYNFIFKKKHVREEKR